MSATNPFGILKQQPRYKIDIDALTSAYLEVQNSCHPDRFINQPKEVQLEAQNKSAAVNAAYQELKDPVKRAAAVMRLMKISIPGEGDNTVADEATLMEAMELREKLAELESPAELQEFIAAASDKFKDLQNEIDQEILAVSKNTHESERVRAVYLSLNFYAKLISSAQQQYQKLSVKIR